MGFRNPNRADNNPIFDTTQLNKAFSNNVDFPEPNRPNSSFKSNKTEPNVLIGQNLQPANQPKQQPVTIPLAPTSQNNSNSQQTGNAAAMGFGMGYGGSHYDNLMYGNLNLSNWLSSVKTNNNGLYDGMMGHSIPEQMMHKNNLERYLQSEQQQKMLELSRLPQN